MKPDFELLRKINTRGIIVTSIESSKKYDFVSRFFALSYGIDENPVTSSTHCCLGPYWNWSKKLNKVVLMAYQASERGSCMKVKVNGDRVYLSGQAITVFKLNLRE